MHRMARFSAPDHTGRPAIASGGPFFWGGPAKITTRFNSSEGEKIYSLGNILGQVRVAPPAGGGALGRPGFLFRFCFCCFLFFGSLFYHQPEGGSSFFRARKHGCGGLREPPGLPAWGHPQKKNGGAGRVIWFWPGPSKNPRIWPPGTADGKFLKKKKTTRGQKAALKKKTQKKNFSKLLLDGRGKKKRGLFFLCYTEGNEPKTKPPGRQPKGKPRIKKWKFSRKKCFTNPVSVQGKRETVFCRTFQGAKTKGFFFS